MKYKNVFWGVILIIIGSLFILKNLDIVYFTWGSLLRLWPILLILWGVSIIPVKDQVKILLSVVVIALAILLMVNNRHYWNWWDFSFGDKWRYEYYDEDRYYDEDDEWVTQEIYEPYNDDINYVTLNFDAAIGDFRIDETSRHLMEFEKEGNLGPYKYSNKSMDDKMILNLDLKKHTFRGSNFRNEAVIKLNTDPVWNLNVDVGAAEIDLDLTSFKVENLDIDGGASSIKVRIGDKYDQVKLFIDAGASSLTVWIPEESGCELDVSTFLTSRNFDGFDKLVDGLYQTPNFDDSDNIIYITIDAAVAGLNIRRY